MNRRELSSTFSSMCSFVDGLIKEMNSDLNSLDLEVDRLSASSDDALQLRNKSDALILALDHFRDKYLTAGSPK